MVGEHPISSRMLMLHALFSQDPSLMLALRMQLQAKKTFICPKIRLFCSLRTHT